MMTPNSCPAWSSAASAVKGAGVFDRLLGRLIEECESFGLATTMVIPSGLALDVQGAAFREGFRGVDFVISGRTRITARQHRDLANNLLGIEPSAS
jgi:hypothetical protein